MAECRRMLVFAGTIDSIESFQKLLENAGSCHRVILQVRKKTWNTQA